MHNAIFGRSGLPVSRLGLGTAEIGFAYGIGTPTLPGENEAIALLKRAVDLGIIFFDTANYYGLAEERIGKSGILRDESVIVCTKCAQFLERGEYFPDAELRARIRTEVESSLLKLNVETLPLLLLHGPSAEQLEDGVLTGVVAELRQEGKVRFWGASTRGEESPMAAIQVGADVIQVAFSIADQRMRPRILLHASKSDIGVISRSVFLKGVFAGKAEHLPGALAPLKSVVSAAAVIAEDAGISLTELALRYALSEPTIDVTLVGTARIGHLEHAADALARGPLPTDVLKALASLAIPDPEQVDPGRWPEA